MMMMNMESKEDDVAAKRAEIDTRAPFRSVKEAVMLFGERVLAREAYANKLNQMRAAASKNEHEYGSSRFNSIEAELEETRQSLEKAREESLVMANCLTSLKEELEKTKKELKELKERESEKQVIEWEIEDLKFVENAIEVEAEKPVIDQRAEFQKKRCVTFANPPSLAQILNPEEAVLQRQFSVGKIAAPMHKKKKPLIPLIGGIFSKKKAYHEGLSPRAVRS